MIITEKTVISSKKKLFDFKFKELLKYHDLIFLFFKRNYSTRYKQTVLGPAWLVLIPLFTVCMQTLIFGKIAGLSTDGIPLPLFYLAGNIIWLYFSNIVSECASTFSANAFIFGKVYFPRLVAPVSQIITSAADFFIRFVLFLIFAAFIGAKNGVLYFSWRIVLLPVLLLHLAVLGLGVGLIMASLTIKYKDLRILIPILLQFWMYATPVIYSTDIIPQKFLVFFIANPATAPIVLFKNLFFGTDSGWFSYLPYSCLFSAVIFFVGIIAFNTVERTFLDTI